MKKVKLHLNHAGYCFGKENHVLKTGENRNIKFHAMWGLIEHPDQGYILYDTGYSDRFQKLTRSFPNRIYAWATKVFVTENEYVVTQLKKMGIDAKDIKHIILTHFHADHCCGLLDFPEAKIYVHKKAFDHFNALSNTWAFAKGVLKGLIPSDLAKRVVFIDQVSAKMEDQLFNFKYDLFKDESVLVYELPGHAAGQIGIELETEKEKYFLIADACWVRESFIQNVPPNKIVNLFIDSWSDLTRSISRIHDYHKKNPETIIIPSHCAKTTDPLVNTSVGLNKL